MTTIITYARNGWGSVPKISSKMEEDHQVMRVRRDDTTEPCDLLIRWASRVRWPNAGKVINKARAIGRASDKAGCRWDLLMASKDDSRLTIPVSIVNQDNRFVGPGRFPWVFRPPTHQGGEDFYIVDDPRGIEEIPFQPGWYVSSFYPKTHEYRVHVAHGRVLLVNEKVPREGQEEKRSEPIWNHAVNDFEFKVLRWRDLPIPAMRVAIQACEVLGLDYAGVDVMTDAGDDWPEAVVCEVNCSPTLENYAAEQYAIYFDWLIKTGGKEPHFPMPELGVHPQTYIFREVIK